MVPLVINHPKGTTIVPTNNEPVFPSAFRGTMFCWVPVRRRVSGRWLWPSCHWQLTSLCGEVLFHTTRWQLEGRGWWGVSDEGWKIWVDVKGEQGRSVFGMESFHQENRLPWDRKFIDLFSFTELEGIIHYEKGPIRMRANHHSRRLFFWRAGMIFGVAVVPNQGWRVLVCWKGLCLFCFLEVLKLKAKKQETFETHKDFIQVRTVICTLTQAPLMLILGRNTNRLKQPHPPVRYYPYPGFRWFVGTLCWLKCFKRNQKSNSGDMRNCYCW